MSELVSDLLITAVVLLSVLWLLRYRHRKIEKELEDKQCHCGVAEFPATCGKRGYGEIATPEEIRQHDEEFEIRKLYWHVLAYVDKIGQFDADWHSHMDDMAVVYKHLKNYDVRSACKLPNGGCTCSGAGIKKL